MQYLIYHILYVRLLIYIYHLISSQSLLKKKHKAICNFLTNIPWPLTTLTSQLLPSSKTFIGPTLDNRARFFSRFSEDGDDARGGVKPWGLWTTVDEYLVICYSLLLKPWPSRNSWFTQLPSNKWRFSPSFFGMFTRCYQLCFIPWTQSRALWICRHWARAASDIAFILATAEDNLRQYQTISHYDDISIRINPII